MKYKPLPDKRNTSKGITPNKSIRRPVSKKQAPVANKKGNR